MHRLRSGWGELHHPVVVDSEYQWRAAGSIGRGSLLSVLRERLGNLPDMAEGILDASDTPAIAFVYYRAKNLRPGGDGVVECRVRIVHDEDHAG